MPRKHVNKPTDEVEMEIEPEALAEMTGQPPEPEHPAVAAAPEPDDPDPAPVFPPAPASGQWTIEEHDQAVLAYEHALLTDNPDAGRMRSVIGLFRNPERPYIGARVEI